MLLAMQGQQRLSLYGLSFASVSRCVSCCFANQEDFVGSARKGGLRNKICVKNSLCQVLYKKPWKSPIHLYRPLLYPLFHIPSVLRIALSVQFNSSRNVTKNSSRKLRFEPRYQKTETLKSLVMISLYDHQ